MAEVRAMLKKPDLPATDTSHIATADRSKEVCAYGKASDLPNAACIVAACNALLALLDRLDKAEAALSVERIAGRCLAVAVTRRQAVLSGEGRLRHSGESDRRRPTRRPHLNRQGDPGMMFLCGPEDFHPYECGGKGKVPPLRPTRP